MASSMKQKRIECRLYFDGIRSRLFDGHFWYDFCFFTDLESAASWARANGVEFMDHRLELQPRWLRPWLLRARAAGSKWLDKAQVDYSRMACGVVAVNIPALRPYIYNKPDKGPKRNGNYRSGKCRSVLMESNDGITWRRTI